MIFFLTGLPNVGTIVFTAVLTKEDKNEILKPEEKSDDLKSLRPERLSEFIGQDGLKNNLGIFIKAAITRGDAIDHLLFYGPPGLGKTTLAKIVSNELGVGFKSTSGPILSKAGDLAAILTNLKQSDILFIDEIHRLSISVEEMLYQAMEDYAIDILIGEGPSARSVKIDIPKFTLIGATTRIGLLSNPLRSRFGMPFNLQFYNNEELSTIARLNAKKLGFTVNDACGIEIAMRSRFTPRIAIRILKRLVDFATVLNTTVIDTTIASNAFQSLGIDSYGLDDFDRKYLRYIIEGYDGGPVGIQTVSAGLSEERDSLEDTVEPFLLQIKFLARTHRGRVITKKAYEHLGIEYNKNQENNEEESQLL